MSDTGRLLVTQTPEATIVEGVVGASPDLMAIVGTVKEASEQVVDSADQLERAIVEAAQSGSKVMDGYIKFAKPITVKTAQTIKEASNAPAVLDDNGLMGFIGKLSLLESLDDADGIEKLAACDFVENMLSQIELDKVDGNEVGLTAPVKVAFKDDKTKDWFLSLFNKKAEEEKSAKDNLIERLVAAGVDKSAALERMVRRLEKKSHR